MSNLTTTICVISDTHNKHKQLKDLPAADIIIHCGDLTSMGYEHEVRNFLKWFDSLVQYDHKIFIAGNHDWGFETKGLQFRNLVPENITYLEDSGIEIYGLKIYGSPVSKHFNDWAFNRDSNILQKHWAAIPEDTDILITHTLPYQTLDYVPYNVSYEGCPYLRQEVFHRIKPLVHIGGHIHESYGVKVINEITFINATVLNGKYILTNKPILFEITEKRKVNIIDY